MRWWSENGKQCGIAMKEDEITSFESRKLNCPKGLLRCVGVLL
jgi:hypothetical protein